MNSALPLTDAAGAGSPTRAAERAEQHDADLYARWSAIFEHARPADSARGAAPALPGTDSQPDAGAPRSVARSPWQDGAVRGAAAHTVRVAVPGAATGTNAPHAASSMADTRRAPGAPMPAPPFAPAEARASRCAPPGGTPARARAGTALPGAAVTQEGAESLHVSIRDAAVTIVARADLPERDAVHCAFEAARHLAGTRAALRRLTFNGRVLYERPDERAAAPSGPLVFAC